MLLRNQGDVSPAVARLRCGQVISEHFSRCATLATPSRVRVSAARHSSAGDTCDCLGAGFCAPDLPANRKILVALLAWSRRKFCALTQRVPAQLPTPCISRSPVWIGVGAALGASRTVPGVAGAPTYRERSSRPSIKTVRAVRTSLVSAPWLTRERVAERISSASCRSPFWNRNRDKLVAARNSNEKVPCCVESEDRKSVV